MRAIYFFKSLMGEVFQISLPTEGQTVDQGEPLIAVEAQFKSKVFHAPLGGQVLEVNQDVIDDPTLINSSPDLFGYQLLCSFGLASSIFVTLNPSAVCGAFKASVMTY